MKAYLIDALNRTITDIDYTGSLGRWLPGGICIADRLPNGDVVYVDDEGLMQPATRAFRWRPRPDGQPMMSNGIVTGRDTADTTLPPTTTKADIEALVEWLTVDEAVAWFERKRDEPAVCITTSAGTEVISRWGDYLGDLLSKPVEQG
jgi:hypothetical protein